MDKVDFVVGKQYKDLTGNVWTVTALEPAFIHVKLKGPFSRKFRRTTYCGVNAAIFDYGQNRIVADEIKPQFDPEIDLPPRNNNDVINTHGETYVDLFKRHKEEN